MNKTATQCREWANALARSIGMEQASAVLRDAATEIERLEREATAGRETATAKVDGKARRQG